MARVAVIGAGAIGGTIAAWLAEAGHDVFLCVRTPIDHIEVATPAGTLRPDVTIWRGIDAAQPVDWVLAATKTYDSAAAAAWLPALRGPATPLAVLQNGIEQVENFAGAPAPIVPAIVDIPAERDAPGRIRQRRLGSIRVPDGAAGSAFAALFAGTGIDAATTADFADIAWRKLAINCAGAVNALTLKPAGISRDPAVAELMRGLIHECRAVAAAEGVVLPAAVADEIVTGYQRGPADGVNSLLADRLAGRRMEAEARNDVIVRRGARYGVATPLNSMACALLSAVQPD
ncbi:2-dehydropantoate 2-reductase [Sphingomonas parva]|uniref:2-dehydropantoate 2-reductase n=1 Tax=Sphingomonas parva TaxID=2555898 RepID=A0A4Y8ZU94_9SPHN|nr:2-dehydropantoate 2-reductase [Sphingomonas parva]TFI58715.1 2-dehydropantoate 2-reductase [Sphingomonas parva]